MEPGDDELLAAAAHDREAFAAFYRRHARPLAGYFLSRTRDREAAADLTAETFAAALADRARFDPAKGSAVGWLYGIARHKLAHLHQRRSLDTRARRRVGIEAIALDDPMLERFEAEASSASSRLVELLSELPSDQREAIEGRVLEEREYRELAAGDEAGEPAVRKRVSRGLATLRRRLEEPPS